MAGTATGHGADTLSSIESVAGTTGNDTISGTDRGDILNGGEGDDTLYGNAGNDQIWGHAGTDTVNGGAGTNDRCWGETVIGCEITNVPGQSTRHRLVRAA